MATLKTTVCFASENVSICMLPIFLLPLVNDLGPVSTLENQGFPRNKCALHALLGWLAADRQTSCPHAKNIPISTLNLTYKNNNNKKTYKNQSLFLNLLLEKMKVPQKSCRVVSLRCEGGFGEKLRLVVFGCYKRYIDIYSIYCIVLRTRLY